MKKLLLIIIIFVNIVFSSNDYTYLSFNDGLRIKNATDFIIKTQPKMYTESTATDIALNIWEAANAKELEYEYVMAIIMTESRFNYNAKSYCGAIGLMQIMPSTFLSIAKKNSLNYSQSDIYDINKNIEVGVLYLSYLNKRYGSHDLISAGYNGGPGVANRWKKAEYEKIPDETKDYVSKVKKHREYFIFKLNEEA